MSKVLADSLQGRATGNEAPDCPKGLTVTGVTTSSGGFDGNLTGNVTGNATGLTGTPSVTVNLLTATDANVGGALTVGGVLTYEDVTQVDSVGIVTARQGVRVLAGGIQAVGLYTGFKASGVSTFAGGDFLVDGSAVGVTSVTWDASADSLIFKDSSKTCYGDGGDLKVYHDGTHNRILTGANLYINNAAMSETLASFIPDGACTLHYNDSTKLQTDNAGIIVTGVSTSTAGIHAGPGILRENMRGYGSAMNGAYTADVLSTGMVLNAPTNSTGTFTINLRGDGSTTFNSIMNSGESTVFTAFIGQNNTSYYLTDFQIDGSSITEEWNGGSAPSAGGASGTDIYTFTILKTANATFSVFANVANFA